MNGNLVGRVVKVSVPVLENKAGSYGIVIEQYKSVDDNEPRDGLTIIHQNGEWCGWCGQEVEQFVTFLPEFTPQWEGYEFRNAFQVNKDWNSGFWKFTEELIESWDLVTFVSREYAEKMVRHEESKGCIISGGEILEI